MSLILRKPTLCLCEHKGTYQPVYLHCLIGTSVACLSDCMDTLLLLVCVYIRSLDF